MKQCLLDTSLFVEPTPYKPGLISEFEANAKSAINDGILAARTKAAASFMDVKLPPKSDIDRVFEPQSKKFNRFEDFRPAADKPFWDGRIVPGFGTYQGGNKYGADGPVMITPSENLRNAAIKALAGLLDFVDAIDKHMTRAPPS
jgi:hypothetical protein